MSQPAHKSATPDDFIAAGHTPMMAQYMVVKAAHPDCLLFYRMGDFFELFFDDAVTAAQVLDITLTRRGKTDGADIPMCGVPAHAYEPYLARLIKAGFKVAMCDQTETPDQAKAARGAKALVNRDVVRIVTPGTLTEDTLLDARAPAHLAALTVTNGDIGAAWLDLSTGNFCTQKIAAGDVAATLARIAPREILISDRLYTQDSWRGILALYDRAVTQIPSSLFDAQNAAARLKTHYGAKALDAFGAFSAAEIAAAGSLLDYTERTQKAAVMHLRTPQQVHDDTLMAMDAATRRNLELTETLSGNRAGSLLHTIDRTVTAAGGRLLHAWMMAPLCTLAPIAERHDRIEFFFAHTDVRAQVRDCLKTAPDMERALARLALGRGAPRDLAAVQGGLAALQSLSHILQTHQGAVAPAIDQLIHDLHQSGAVQTVHDTLASALADELPAALQDGNFIRAGFDAALDHERSLRHDGRRMIAALQQKYADDTRAEGLKIAHNNILGYYIEVSARRADALMTRPETYIHRQTMANAMRFTTTELAALERDLLQAEGKAMAIELDLFHKLTDQVLSFRAELTTLAIAMATTDVSCGLADLAAHDGYVRPVMREDTSFVIDQGRHPVVEAALKRQNVPFMPNDADMTKDQRLWLLTGPNMAGKSTFLRQNALIILLAQMGSFVPAAAARIGLVDRLFSRVGASDDLAQGRSTFMVEMVETAAILNGATHRSFVILDEIGRGTATFDGLSIAWACLEYLHHVTRCRALFATHYHELTALQSSLPHLYTATMEVKEWQGDIVFLHTVIAGSAGHSYGIHVARLAGLPASVTARAEIILKELERGHDTGSVPEKLVEGLPLFSAATPATGAPGASQNNPAPVHPAVQKLGAVQIDDLTPREALALLYELKNMG